MQRKIATFHALSCAVALSLSAAHAADRPQYERINLGALVQGETYDELVVKYREGSAQRAQPGAGVAEAASQAWAGAIGAAGGGISHVRRLSVGADVIRLPHALDTAEVQQLMSAIAVDPNVEYVEPVVRMEKFNPPNDPRWGEQWHYHAPAESAGGVNLLPAWEHGRGEGVVVAVLDTGVTDHPDLADNVLLAEGYDFVLRQPGGYDPGDFEELCFTPTLCLLIKPSSWHGTHVAGTVAAVTDNGIGVAGVAPEAVVLPVRVLGPGGGGSADIADGIVWSVGGDVQDVPANQFPAEVINMSLGSRDPMACPNVFRDALAEANRRNVTVVVAAGNSANNAGNEWGVGHTMSNCSDDIIVVGGVGPTGARGGVSRTGETGTGGSNHGARIDIAAPYGTGWVPAEDNVLSTHNSGQRGPESPTYEFSPGTSMAAPHVAGAVALMQGVAPERLSPLQVKRILQDTVRPFPVDLDQPLGPGILDVAAAMVAATEVPCDQTAAGCGLLPAQRLFNAVPLTPLSSAGTDGERFYTFEATAGSVLNILSSGGTGNATVHVSFDQVPGADAYDFRSVRPGTNQVIRITAPQAGTYHVRLAGEYEGVTLRAQQSR